MLGARLAPQLRQVAAHILDHSVADQALLHAVKLAGAVLLPQHNGLGEGAVLAAQQGCNAQHPLPQPPLRHPHLHFSRRFRGTAAWVSQDRVLRKSFSPLSEKAGKGTHPFPAVQLGVLQGPCSWQLDCQLQDWGRLQTDESHRLPDCMVGSDAKLHRACIVRE